MEELNQEHVNIEFTKAKPKSVHAKNINTADTNPEDEGQLAVDVYETDDEIVIRSAIAGVDHEDLEIHITEEMVSVRGTRYEPEDDTSETRTYYTQECFWGTFSRTIVLSQDIDPDHAVAALKNGILNIHLPKSNQKKAKTLKIKVGD